MASSGLSALLLVAAVIAAEPGFAFKLEPADTTCHFPPLHDCSPAYKAASSSSSPAFRGNVRSLLYAIPSAAADSPAGFVVAWSQPHGAFARGLCLGYGGNGPSSPAAAADCLACLSAAATDVATRCNGSRRGATWRAGCFLAFADTNATSPRESAFLDWFYDDGESGPTPAAVLGAQCMIPNVDGAAAECARCLDESARVVPELKRTHRVSRVHGNAVVVVGYSCFLRVLLEDPLPQWRVIADVVLVILEIVVTLGLGVWGILFCIRRAGQMNPNPA